ncbi:hypothetical protein M514_06790 [Trichuris suis]|uniref:Uncharacterized protein n=1 Tax=Trichuris suis TaxID=68888 RepID=A0A085NKJ4_9BILA|nr:hypothetical protein M513_06790 [Trichuris suis]KFD69990.1 hypothetical protein M514_06790 [Trichuris suis]
MLTRQFSVWYALCAGWTRTFSRRTATGLKAMGSNNGCPGLTVQSLLFGSLLIGEKAELGLIRSVLFLGPEDRSATVLEPGTTIMGGNPLCRLKWLTVEK